MSMYNYIQTDSNGLIFHVLESGKQADSGSSLIQVDAYDVSYLGRYYLDGAIGPAPSEGHQWRWNTETEEFEEVALPA